jgi:RHS repeat-associated protein
MVDLSGTTTYGYDDLYRLTGVTYPNDDDVSYAYDANGNRTSMTVNGGTPTSYTYDDADQMTQAGGVSYTYDDSGNLTDRGDDSFSYDYENRLVEATVSQTTASFTYNGLGRRVSKTVGANTTDYLWSNAGSLPDVLYDGNYYVYGLGLISKTDSQSNQLYYLADGLGSTTGLTDDQGDVVGTYTYDVFGALRSESGGQANAFKFTGQQLDDETSFYYLRARYYDPAVGRFPSRDPFRGLLSRPQSQNPYPYVINNPALYVDPYGLLFGLECSNPVDCAKDAVETGGDIAGGAGDAIDDALDRGGDLLNDVTDATNQFLRSDCGGFALDVAQLGYYIPNPVTQGIAGAATVVQFVTGAPAQAKEGDWVGASLSTAGYLGAFAPALTDNPLVRRAALGVEAVEFYTSGSACLESLF